MPKKDNPAPKVIKTDEEWQAELTLDQFYIARKHGTEPSFSGPYWDEKSPGTYECICCGTELFNADTKYDSGTGWPSFYQPVKEEAIAEYDDRSLFSRRTEVRCSNCDAHLGHVFPDGPKPTGLRYCINGTVLKHIPTK